MFFEFGILSDTFRRFNRVFRSCRTVFLALFLVLSVCGIARAEETNSIIAVCNGEPVTYSDIKYSYEFRLYALQAQAIGKYGSLTSMTEEQRREFEQSCYNQLAMIVRQHILHKLVQSDGTARGLLPLPEAVVANVERNMQAVIDRSIEIRQWIAFLKANRIDEAPVREYLKQIEITRYIASRIVGEPDFISPASMKKYYEENKQKWYRPEQVQLRVIRLPFAEYGTDGALPKANEILELLTKGETFGELAKKFSKESLAANGGLWEIREPSAYSDQIRTAIANLKEGENTKPMIVGNSVMIYMMEKHYTAGPRPFSEVRIEIKRILESESLQRKQDRWVKSIYQTATVRYIEPNVAKILKEWEAKESVVESGSEESEPAEQGKNE